MFYHFSDFINKNTGDFVKDFRLPPGYKVVELEQSIKKTVRRADLAVNEDKKLEACDDLLGLLHQQEPTKDPLFWNWKAGVVSEVCYASGTTNKIDLFNIKKSVGMTPALKIFQETVQGAMALFKTRNMERHATEEFVFFKHTNDTGFRYPYRINGFKTDPGTGRPRMPVKVEEFYQLRDTSYSSLVDLKFKAEQCPSNWQHLGFDMTKNRTKCSSNYLTFVSDTGRIRRADLCRIKMSSPFLRLPRDQPPKPRTIAPPKMVYGFRWTTEAILMFVTFSYEKPSSWKMSF